MRILFLGHEATRSGAPLLLFMLIDWLRRNADIQPSVLLLRGGVLQRCYQELAPTTTLVSSRIQRILLRFHCNWFNRSDLASAFPLDKFPVVYANSVASVSLLRHFAQNGRIIIHHVHELAGVTKQLRCMALMKEAVEFTSLYIAASDAVKEFLCDSIGVPANRIAVIREYAINIVDDENLSCGQDMIRDQLGLGSGEILVSMCGTPERRKGTDLFVRLARLVDARRQGAKIHFLWLGGTHAGLRRYRLQARLLGVEKICHFHPSVQRPQDWLASADIFALTSREDPFSVVMLEAASMGLPIVCFSGAGGGPELVQNDSGIVVPYLNLDAMADACIKLAANDSLRMQLGSVARRKIRTRYRLEHKGPEVLAEIHKLIQ